MSVNEVASVDRDDAEGIDLPQLAPLIAPRKLAEDAATILREQILKGGFRRGTHLVEAKLAVRLGVSRGTIREAFKTLVAEGLIDEEPRRGAFVVTLGASDVREIYELRAAIEGCAARLLPGYRRRPPMRGSAGTKHEYEWGFPREQRSRRIRHGAARPA